MSVTAGNALMAGCPSREALALIADKWTVLVIACLKVEPCRFQALKRAIDGISQTMLTRTLREMERSGLVSRDVRVGRTLSVTYSLTPLGRSLVAPLAALRRWAEDNMEAVVNARRQFELMTVDDRD